MERNTLLGIIAVIAVISILYFTGAYSQTDETEDVVPVDTTFPTVTVTETEDETSPTPSPSDQEMMTLLVYFNNMQSSEECSEVFPVQRQVLRTQTPAQTSMELLIESPTAEEQEQGYSSNISGDTQLNSIRIENATAYVDFNENLDASGSCAVQSIRAQITETLQQFPTVNEVVISIEGETEEILQP